MSQVIVTNLYPGHIRFEPMRMGFERAGYELVSIARKPGAAPGFARPAAGQFVFNYPMSSELVRAFLGRCAAGEPAVVMMDDPLAFFDENINRLIVPVLRAAVRVFTSTDNMLPVYESLGVRAELLVGLANPQFEVDGPPAEPDMEYDWGFIGTLIPPRFRFFWELPRLLPGSKYYFATKGLAPEQVKERVRRTRCNIAYGNFSDLVDFKSNGTTFRSWEFPYAWGFLIQEDRPLLHRFFVEGESMVVFRSVEECAERVRYYLARPEERRAIAGAARAVIHGHPLRDFLQRVYPEARERAARHGSPGGRGDGRGD